MLLYAFLAQKFTAQELDAVNLAYAAARSEGWKARKWP
jgi:hypothetical protein